MSSENKQSSDPLYFPQFTIINVNYGSFFWQVNHRTSFVSALIGLRLASTGALCATCAHALFAEVAVHAYCFLLKKTHGVMTRKCHAALLSTLYCPHVWHLTAIDVVKTRTQVDPRLRTRHGLFSGGRLIIVATWIPT